MKRALLLIAVAALSACVAPQKRVDPFASLRPTVARDPDLSRLRVALLPSANSQNAVDYIAKWRKVVWTDVTDKIFGGIPETLQKNFQSVVKIDSLEQAAEASVDLIAVVDVVVELPTNIYQSAKLDQRVIFLAPDHRQVAEARGISEHAVRENKNSFSNRIIWAVDLVSTEAPARLAEAIAASQELKVFARRKPGVVHESAPVHRAPSTPLLVTDVDEPTYRASPRPDDLALVVGIENYQNLPPASNAVRDARAMRKHLLALGFAERNVIMLEDDRAGISGLTKNLEEWLPRNAKPGSTVYFFYSGHGAPDPTSGEAYLVPWDADAGYLKTTGYSLRKLYAKLAAMKGVKTLAMIDACFSGAGGRSVLASGARPIVAKQTEAALEEGPVTVISAASGDQIASSFDAKGHGLFTYYLLKGLNGEAADARGRVSAQGLYKYLKPRVQDEARRQNRDQTPVFAPGDSGNSFLR